MKQALRIIAPLCVGLGLGTALSWNWLKAPVASVTAAVQAHAPASQDAEMKRMARRLGLLQARVGALESTQAVEAPSVEEADVAEQQSPLEQVSLKTAEIERQRVEHQQQQLETRLRAEPRDTQWTRRLDADLRAVLTDEVFRGSQVIGTPECATSLCRAQVAHDSAEAQESFELNIHLFAPENSGGFTRTVSDEAGRLVTSLYLARKGAFDVMTARVEDDTVHGERSPHVAP